MHKSSFNICAEKCSPLFTQCSITKGYISTRLNNLFSTYCTIISLKWLHLNSMLYRSTPKYCVDICNEISLKSLSILCFYFNIWFVIMSACNVYTFFLVTSLKYFQSGDSYCCCRIGMHISSVSFLYHVQNLF